MFPTRNRCVHHPHQAGAKAPRICPPPPHAAGGSPAPAKSRDMQSAPPGKPVLPGNAAESPANRTRRTHTLRSVALVRGEQQTPPASKDFTLCYGYKEKRPMVKKFLPVQGRLIRRRPRTPVAAPHEGPSVPWRGRHAKVRFHHGTPKERPLAPERRPGNGFRHGNLLIRVPSQIPGPRENYFYFNRLKNEAFFPCHRMAPGRAATTGPIGRKAVFFTIPHNISARYSMCDTLTR